jgi:hypothetical protein
MQACARFVFLIVSVAVVMNMPAYAKDADWQSHYTKAERAYANRNLFEARHEFLIALKKAENCQQHDELAQRLENLASSYQAQDNQMLAQPLLKLVHKMKSGAM